MPGSRPKAPTPSLQPPRDPAPRNAAQALARLSTGNERFMKGRPLHPHEGVRHRAAVAAGQHPFAVIVACADSREAPELLFDCGLGDLFVIRTAGHVIGTTALGSVEFGALQLGVPLIVVLGHSRCGAVAAALHAHATPDAPALPGHLGALIDRLTPAIHAARTHLPPNASPDEWHEATMRAHVHLSVQTLRGSDVLAERIQQGTLQVIGAQYDLDTGQVTFSGADDPPAARP